MIVLSLLVNLFTCTFVISTEYAEVADTVKKYFKKLCKRYFNEVYLKEKEEKERTPSPDHEKAVKEFEDESESDDDSGSDSDASEFGVSKKPKQKKGKGGEKDDPTGMEMPPGAMWPQGPRGPIGPNGLTINSGTLENLRRLTGGVNTFPPRMPPGLPPNAPPHVQQEYYAKMQMYQRQRYMQEMMRRQQHHQQQQQQHQHHPQQGSGYPRYPAPGMPGMEGMPPSGPPSHGMPPRHPHHPEMYGMGPPNYPYPGDHMMHPYHQQQHPGYRGHRPPYHNYPNNPQEHYRMPPPDYNEAAKAQWYKGHRGMIPPQGDEMPNDGSGIKSPLDKNVRRSSVSSEGTGVKSPLSSEVRSPASSLPPQAPSDTSQPSIATTTAKVCNKPDDGSTEKDSEAQPPENEKPAPTGEGPVTGESTPPVSASQPGSEATGADSSKQQQPQADKEAYKRGMEAAYKYHKEQQMKMKQQQQIPPGYSPGYMRPEMGFSPPPHRGGKPHQHHQQRMMTPEHQQEYMQWQQQQEAMWRSQHMGMPTTPMGPGGNPASAGGGPPYSNSGYLPSSKAMEGSPDAYKQQQQEYHHMQQQYMLNRRYMDDMYRQHGYGHPGMHPGVNSHPYGHHHHPGYAGKLPHHKSMEKPTEKGSGQLANSPHQKPEAPGPDEEIPDYNDSLRKYAMGLTGNPPENQDAQISKKDDTAGEEDNTVSSSKEEGQKDSVSDDAQVETVKAGDKGDRPPIQESNEGDKQSEPNKFKMASDEKDSTYAPEDVNKDTSSGNVTSPSSSTFPAADSTTQGGSTPDPSRPSSHPSSGSGAAAQNGHNRAHYPPSMYPPQHPQHPQHMYGGWGGGGMSPGYGRGMYPPPPMGGRPESMEEYERYRAYQEQMMAMRHMAPPDPYNGMGMPPHGMSPYEMEQYQHYEMMQGRMGPQMGGNASMGYPGGDQYQQQRHAPSQEDMKKYLMKREQMAAMHKQMRTAYHKQQQIGMPPHASDYTAGVTSPVPQGGQPNKMSAMPPTQQQYPAQQSDPMVTSEGTPELTDNTQEPVTSEGIIVCVFSYCKKLRYYIVNSYLRYSNRSVTREFVILGPPVLQKWQCRKAK